MISYSSQSWTEITLKYVKVMVGVEFVYTVYVYCILWNSSMPLSSWHFFGYWLWASCGFCNQGIITARSRAFLRTMHPRSPTSLPSWATRTDLLTQVSIHGLVMHLHSTFSRQEWPTLSERWTDQAPSWTRKRALKQLFCENSVVKGGLCTLPDLSVHRLTRVVWGRRLKIARLSGKYKSILRNPTE